MAGSKIGAYSEIYVPSQYDVRGKVAIRVFVRLHFPSEGRILRLSRLVKCIEDRTAAETMIHCSTCLAKSQLGNSSLVRGLRLQKGPCKAFGQSLSL